MGSVFLALGGRPGMEKLCVVKRLIADTLSNSDRLARFRREADIVRTLSHGAIAQTLAVDDHEGEPYIVQEFIEGRNLTQLVASARGIGETMPPILGVYVTREVARALAYAHQVAGIVHRDIAPDNVMATFTGEVRLIDFGIARAGTDASLTAPGSFVGRHAYTAPEVLAGQTADPRADIYSLGVVLWELLTGRPPLLSEMEAPPPPSSLVTSPLFPPALDAVVLQAVAADPTRRFASAEDLQRALGPFLPPTFIGERSLADFIGRCYQVDVERRRLQDDIIEARPLLEHGAATDQPSRTRALPEEGSRSKTVETRRSSRSPKRAVQAGAVLLLVSVLAFVVFARRPPEPAPSPTAELVPTPSSAAPAPTPAPHPAPTAPSSVSPGTAPPAPDRATPVAARTVSSPRRAPAALPMGALLDRARDSLQTGDLSSAERDAREVVRDGTASQKSRGHLIVGRVLVFRGHTKAAADEFTAAIELDPRNLAAADDLAQLRKRGSP